MSAFLPILVLAWYIWEKYTQWIKNRTKNTIIKVSIDWNNGKGSEDSDVNLKHVILYFTTVGNDFEIEWITYPSQSV